MIQKIQSVRTTAWMLLLALSGCYIALGPGTTLGRAYVPDDITAGLGMLASFNAWVKGRPVPPLIWTRHGPLPIILDLPFIKLGKIFVSPDFIISLQHELLTAAMMTIVYVWLRKLCTPGVSLLLTLIGTFGTMLWPYAYIGVETKQSFFVLLAGYLALANAKIRGRPKLIAFGAVSGLAISMKSTGAVLIPPIAYLMYVQFRDDWRYRWKEVVAVSCLIVGIWALGAIGWNVFWGPKGGGPQVLMRDWVTTSAFQLFTNVIGLFGAPGKGLFVFAPITLAAVYALPRIFSTHRDLAVFALLVTVCMVALLSILVVTADEVWGPRFLHVAIAPLLVVVGAAVPRFRWSTFLPIVLLGVIGMAISFLGAFYYYGARGWVASAVSQNTLEWYHGDPMWSEIHVDARLFAAYMTPGKDPIYWTPVHHWVWNEAPESETSRHVNLREYADPQSFLLYYWNRPVDGADRVIFRICLVSLIVGPLLLLWVVATSVMSSIRPAAVTRIIST